MDVSIIIVNYNTKDITRDCLNSIYEKTAGIEYEVFVSDNGSTDGSVEMMRAEFPQVHLIENKANLGFGAANNRALDHAKGKYVFYLNSDTILLNNAVKFFFDYFESHDDGHLGGLGCNLLDRNGQVQTSFSESKYVGWDQTDKLLAKYRYMFLSSCKTAVLHFIFRRPLKRIEYTDSHTRMVGKVGNIIGASLFIKNNDFARFDEHYFMYCEDTDLELQLSNNGYEFYMIDGPEIVHLQGASSEKIRYKILDLADFSHCCNNLSAMYFIKKNKLASSFDRFRMKTLLLLFWLNPLVSKNTAPFRKKLLKEWNSTY